MRILGSLAATALVLVAVVAGSWHVAVAGATDLSARSDPSRDPLLEWRVAGDGMPVVTHDPEVAALIAGIDGDRVLDELQRLTGETPLCVNEDCRLLPERVTATANLDHAMKYVEQVGRDLGYEVTVEPWMYANVRGDNVVFRQAGTIWPEEEVWFVAHVDGVHCPKSWEDCAAADDNASGAVAGLEAARLLSGVDFRRTIVLFFSTGEEQGTIGVDEWLKYKSPTDLDVIHSLINADMIGYDGDGDRVMELYHDDDPPSVAVTRVMADVIDVYDVDLVAEFNKGCG